MKNKVALKLVTLILVVSMVCGFMLAGCGDKTDTSAGTSSASSVKDENSAEPVKAEGVKGDLELQIFVGGYGDKVWKDAMDGFKKENPDVNLIVNMGPKINDQMNTRWVSDNPPDFIFLDGPNIPKDQFIKDGKLMELTGWFDTAKNKDTDSLIKDKLIPNVFHKYDNKIFEAPVLFNCWGMWYDEKLFNDMGITPPKNFDELMEMGEKFKTKDIAGMTYAGIYQGYFLEGAIMPAVASEGGQELLSQVGMGNPEVFKSEPFKKVLSRFKAFIDKGYMLKGTVALNHTQSQMEWLNRKAALIPCGLWLENEMKKDIPADFKMKYIPSIFQDKDKKMSVLTYGVSVGIASKAKNPEAAKAFLEYIYRDSTLKSFVEASGSPSAAKLDISNLNVSEVTKNVMQNLSNPDVQYMVPDYSTPAPIGKAWADGISAFVLNKISIDEFCDRLYKAAEGSKQ